MTTVELLYFADCPHVSAAREQLRRAFTTAGLAPAWTELDVNLESAPSYTKGFGSPSVLVDGRDVMGATPGDGSTCRIYAGSEVRGAPPLDAIVSALLASSSPPAHRAISTLAVVPGVLLTALPIVGCPSCWPAYAGVLAALGVPFLMDAAWLLPITAVSLLVALTGLAFRAPNRRGYGPFVLGALAAAAILAGKFIFHQNTAVYPCTALLMAASVWNSWPKKSRCVGSACECEVNSAAST